MFRYKTADYCSIDVKLFFKHFDVVVHFYRNEARYLVAQGPSITIDITE